MPKVNKRRKRYWHLYWVASDGIEDCFVVARNSQSACRVEREMNGFDVSDVRAERILRVPDTLVERYGECSTLGDKRIAWPWYAYQDLLVALGAEIRVIDDVEELLLEEIVYHPTGAGYTQHRTIGVRAWNELNDISQQMNEVLDDEDLWDPNQTHLLTMLGICVVRCQRIESYVANSFILGIADSQKKKYRTINDLISGWKRKTFGQIFPIIRDAYELQPDFDRALDLFVSMRNELIHGITTKEQYDIETPWGCSELLAFLGLFDVISRVVRNAFRASFYASVEFGQTYLDKENLLPDDLLSESQSEEIDLFCQFFNPKLR